jgi:uncharacterized protein YceH (UPF0502 family)
VTKTHRPDGSALDVPTHVVAYVAQLEARVAELEAQLAERDRRIAAMEAFSALVAM